MTVTQLRIESAKLAPLPPLVLPKVDNRTPATIVKSDVPSCTDSTSMPHMTAVAALVIGSAALTVSTNAADAPENDRFVLAKPNAK